MTATLSLIVDAARSPPGMTLADLKDATVAVQAATTDYDAAVAMQRAGAIGNVRVYPFARMADAITDLVAGRVNAVMKVYPVAAWFVRQAPGLRILAQVPDDPQPLGIGFNRNNVGLLAAVNNALADAQRDGSYGLSRGIGACCRSSRDSAQVVTMRPETNGPGRGGYADLSRDVVAAWAVRTASRPGAGAASRTEPEKQRTRKQRRCRR